jgi:flagellar biosynthesis chaperone FliJ
MAVTDASALDAFFEEIKKLGFFGRLFSWGRIRKLSYEASNELAILRSERGNWLQQRHDLERLLESKKQEMDDKVAEVQRLSVELTSVKASLAEVREQVKERESRIRELETSAGSNAELMADLRAQVTALQRQIEERNAQIASYEGRLAEANTAWKKSDERVRQLQTELDACYRKSEDLDSSLKEKDKLITQFESAEASRKEEHAAKVNEVTAFMINLKEDKVRLEKEKEEALRAHMEEMKRTWLNHEIRVEETLRALCSKHTIEYLGKEKVPFRGKPDNTLRICDEYVIFDAKSPQGEDLSNFAAYVNKQAEEVKKYVKEKDVKKDIYLVVPNNTVHVFESYVVNHGDYRVYIVTVDSLEPILLSLKRIEEYEFAEQLSPEEREDICRVIGRLSHLTKRRIQVDSFFCDEAFKALKECGCLPDELAEKTLEYERSAKLNPPQERRAKIIADRELQKSVEMVRKEAEFLGLETTEAVAKTVRGMPLLNEDSEEDQERV